MDYAPPYPVRFKGSSVARMLLRCMGWRIDFAGLPAAQGVVVIYPHTSNWDLVIGILLKWAVGMPLQFWSKANLFSVPLFGRWLRWVGGVPVKRARGQGQSLVEQTVKLIAAKKEQQTYFWLCLSPEGTRGYTPGWRRGFYRVAFNAGVPLGLACLDYSKKRLTFREFIRLSGDETLDMQRIAQVFEGCKGYRPHLASPIVLRALSSGEKA